MNSHNMKSHRSFEARYSARLISGRVIPKCVFLFVVVLCFVQSALAESDYYRQVTFGEGGSARANQSLGARIGG